MKRILISAIVLLFAFSSLNAQITGGGTDKARSSSSSSSKGALDNYSYLTFNRLYAVGDFSSRFSFDKGIGLSFGQVYYLNNINIQDGIKVGIEAGYLNFNSVFTDRADGFEFFEETMNFIGSKVGPMVSYNPTSELVVDAKLTLQPTLLLSDYIDPVFKIRTGLGVYARYKPVMAGFEFSWGEASVDAGYGTIDMPTTRFDFVIGLTF